MCCAIRRNWLKLQYNDASVQLYSTVHVSGTVPAVKTCLFQLRDFRIQKQKNTVYWDEKQCVEQKHKHGGQVKKTWKDQREIQTSVRVCKST